MPELKRGWCWNRKEVVQERLFGTLVGAGAAGRRDRLRGEKAIAVPQDSVSDLTKGAEVP